MTALRGRSEVLRLKQRLEETFRRVDRLPPDGYELRADMARYLCVLVSGYVEKALQELTIEWCRKQSGPTVVKYASTHLRHLQNLNSKRLREVLGAFEASWSDALDSDYPEEISALDSVYGNRNQIAHGGNVGLTLIQVERYYEGVDRIVDYLIALMDPA